MAASTSDTTPRLEQIAHDIRRRVLELTIQQGGCYLSQAASSADLLAALYGEILNLAAVESPLPAPPFRGVPGPGGTGSPSGGRFHGQQGPEFDRFLISPAHYAVAIYAALEVVGRLEEGALETFNEDGSTLEMIGAEHSPGFELTTGSFGQALSQAGGIALARRLRHESGRTVVLMSDGELEEGQTWEAVQAAAFYRIDGLHVYIDVNGQQVDGLTKDVMNIEPIAARFEAFGAEVVSVDGHDLAELTGAAPNRRWHDRPFVVLAYTNPSQGIPLLDERKPHLHYVRFSGEEERDRYRTFLAAMESENA